jgi:hypothetical protein
MSHLIDNICEIQRIGFFHESLEIILALFDIFGKSGVKQESMVVIVCPDAVVTHEAVRIHVECNVCYEWHEVYLPFIPDKVYYVKFVADSEVQGCLKAEFGNIRLVDVR